MKSSLVGLYFLAFTPPPANVLSYQGKVLSQPYPGWFLVQYYDWIMGAPNDIRLFKIEEMSAWFFYDDVEIWRHAAKEYWPDKS